MYETYLDACTKVQYNTAMPNKTAVNTARLKEIMQEKQWNVGELAERSGVSEHTIYSLLTGRRPNTSSRILKLLGDALGVTADRLLAEGEDEAKQKPPESIRRLADVAGRLSEMRREELLRIAAALEKLDREQAGHPLPSEAMRVLVEVAETLKDRPGNEDLLVLVEQLLRRQKGGQCQ